MNEAQIHYTSRALIFHTSFLPCICCGYLPKTAVCSECVLKCMNIQYENCFVCSFAGITSYSIINRVTELEIWKWPCLRSCSLSPRHWEGRPTMTDWSVPNTEEHLPFFFPMLSPMVTRANLVLSLDIFFYFCFCFTFLQESLIPSAFRIVRESSLQTFAIYITHSWT